jgi:hypothetical protein
MATQLDLFTPTRPARTFIAELRWKDYVSVSSHVKIEAPSPDEAKHIAEQTYSDQHIRIIEQANQCP